MQKEADYLSQTEIFYSPYIFATYKSLYIWSSRIHSLKYMSATSGCKDKGIKTIFLWFNLRLFDLAGIILWNLKGLTPILHI